MTYQLYKTPDGQECAMIVNENGSITSFSFDPQNTDYQAFLKFLEDGGQPLPAEVTE